MLPLLVVLSRTLATAAIGPHYRGLCAACHRPVLGTESASGTRSTLHHADCARYRLGNRAKARLPWQR